MSQQTPNGKFARWLGTKTSFIYLRSAMILTLKVDSAPTTGF